MNARQAKKIGCYPCDPQRKPSETTPYSDAQIVESGRVYAMALKRGDRNGRVKWGASRSHTWRGKWRPGFTGEAHYGLKVSRVSK